MQIKKQQLGLDMEKLIGSTLAKKKKKYNKAVYCHSAYLTCIPEYIMWNIGLDESQTGINIARRNRNNIRYADVTTLLAEIEE